MMDEMHLERFMQALFETMSPKARPPELVAVQVRLMKRLLTGGPVPPDEVATIADRPVEDGPMMLAMVAEMGFGELDEHGNLVGMVVTRRQTRHAIAAGDASAHAWCAVDTLFLPAVLEQPLTVASTCPETDTAIALEVGVDAVVTVSPETAYVSLVAPGVTEGVEKCGGGMAGLTTSDGAFCGSSNFFATKNAAEQWLARHKGGLVLPVAEAFELARRVWSEPYRAALK
jgi:alkylmercury lyase